MFTSETLFLALILLIIIVLNLIMVVTLVNKLQKNHEKQLSSTDRALAKKDLMIQDLLNRLMSPDVRTFQIATNTSQMMMNPQQIQDSHSTYNSMSDSAIINRLSGAHVNDEDIYDEQYLDAINELGIRQ